jgi:hypothetical protein
MKAKDPSLIPKDPWKAWDKHKRESFIRIAGETLALLGYPLDFD